MSKSKAIVLKYYFGNTESHQIEKYTFMYMYILCVYLGATDNLPARLSAGIFNIFWFLESARIIQSAK